MKTLLFAAAMALTTLTASANKESSKNKVSFQFSRSFEKEFGRVEDVSWSPSANNMYRAEFTKDGESVSAFFNEQGELVAETVALTPSDLPAKIRVAVTKKGVPTEAIRLINAAEEAYFVKVYADGKDRIYKAFTSGNLVEVDL